VASQVKSGRWPYAPCRKDANRHFGARRVRLFHRTTTPEIEITFVVALVEVDIFESPSERVRVAGFGKKVFEG